jgi:adenylate cyclase
LTIALLKPRLLKGRLYLTLGFLLLFLGNVYNQNQALADSLESILLNKNYQEEDYLRLLRDLATDQPDPEKKLINSRELIDAARQLDSTEYLLSGFTQRGNAYRLKGDLQSALESYFEAAKIASEGGLKSQLASVNIAIADVYSIMGNHDIAVDYYNTSIEVLRQEKDSINLASALLNAGDEYFNHEELDSALFYFKESEAIFRALNYELGIAYNLGNVGLVYAAQNKDLLAEEEINKSIRYLESLQDYYPISVYLLYMADIYIRKGDFSKAVNYVNRSLDLSKQYGLKEQLSEANLKLSEIYEKAGNYQKSLFHFKEYITFRDSVRNIETVQNMANLRTEFEVSQKQTEIDLLEKEAELQGLRERRQRYINYIAGIILISVLLLGFGLYRRYYYIKKTNKIIEEERNRSDDLLLNILPAETAVELKQNGKVQAKKFDSVTVLFTDFKEFTNYSEQLSPEKLVESIDFYFSKFDEIMEKYGLEKIKTVGDAYMCAGGLPFITQDHAHRMVKAAFEIVEFVKSIQAHNEENVAPFDVRIGVNTGPVIAGVVGTKKFAYDIWGDTVNIAARMESNGEAGKINISQDTYELVKDSFDCQFRGEVEVRNKGKMKMYFVNR